MTANEFKTASYNAYIAYVNLIEGNASIEETLSSLSPIMADHGYTLTAENLINALTVKMTAFGKDKGEQAKKVKSISTFRAFIKGGWRDVEAAPVHSNAGKNPADAKASKSTKKGLTKAELAAQVEAMAKILAANGITVSESTAA